jgi:hypothetical protein
MHEHSQLEKKQQIILLTIIMPVGQEFRLAMTGYIKSQISEWRQVSLTVEDSEISAGKYKMYYFRKFRKE